MPSVRPGQNSHFEDSEEQFKYVWYAAIAIRVMTDMSVMIDMPVIAGYQTYTNWDVIPRVFTRRFSKLSNSVLTQVALQ